MVEGGLHAIGWGVLFRLEAARYSAVVTTVNGITDNNYGPAVARVTLWDELKQPIGTVEFFADVQTGQTYAKTSAHIGLLKVDEELLHSLPTQYDQLVYRR